MVVVGPFFRPPKLAPVPKDILARFGLKSAKLYYPVLANFEDEKVTPSSGTTLEAVQPLHLLPLSCFKEVGELDFLIIESRENVYDDFQLVLGFEHRKRVGGPRRQYGPPLGYQNLSRQRQQTGVSPRFKATRSHQLFLTSISDCLTSLAYGDGVQILAPIAASRWNFEVEPKSASVPPIIVIANYDNKVSTGSFDLIDEPIAIPSRVGALSRSATGQNNPLKPAPPVMNDAIRDYGHHIRHRSHEELRRLYLSLDLVEQFLISADSTSSNTDGMVSLEAVTAALKLTFVHELAHYVVSLKHPEDGSPMRQDTRGASRPEFNNCTTVNGRLESGLVTEKLWTGHSYGLARNSNSQLVLFHRDGPEESGGSTGSTSQGASDEDSDESGGSHLSWFMQPPASPDIPEEEEREEKGCNGESRDLDTELWQYDLEVIWLEERETVARFMSAELPHFSALPQAPRPEQKRCIRYRSSSTPLDERCLESTGLLPVISPTCLSPELEHPKPRIFDSPMTPTPQAYTDIVLPTPRPEQKRFIQPLRFRHDCVK
ncbi:hypothetical protein C8J56DRAFT_1061555 [Mycena floridula]|nr:hypothetical protein C8J56DRAFT_1061555 [Mycena floridula]